MSISETKSERWRARVKHGGQVVADCTFDRKGDAVLWESDQKRSLALESFIDPKRGRESLDSLLLRWLIVREVSVASKSFQNDKAMLGKHLPPTMRHKPIGSIRTSEIETLTTSMLRTGLARSSVVRVQASMSALFQSAVDEGAWPRASQLISPARFVRSGWPSFEA